MGFVRYYWLLLLRLVFWSIYVKLVYTYTAINPKDTNIYVTWSSKGITALNGSILLFYNTLNIKREDNWKVLVFPCTRSLLKLQEKFPVRRPGGSGKQQIIKSHPSVHDSIGPGKKGLEICTLTSSQWCQCWLVQRPSSENHCTN